MKDREAKENGIWTSHSEGAAEDNPGRTEGEYRVLLPDGRLMIVSYFVDGDSGFQPTITYEDNYVPDFE